MPTDSPENPRWHQAMRRRCSTLADSLEAQQDAAQRLLLEREQETWFSSCVVWSGLWNHWHARNCQDLDICMCFLWSCVYIIYLYYNKNSTVIVNIVIASRKETIVCNNVEMWCALLQEMQPPSMVRGWIVFHWTKPRIPPSYSLHHWWSPGSIADLRSWTRSWRMQRLSRRRPSRLAEAPKLFGKVLVTI